MRWTVLSFARARLLVPAGLLALGSLSSSAGLLALAGLPASAAYAQSEADLLDAARTCQQVTGLSERLACYDRVFPPADRTVASESRTAGSAPTGRAPQATDAAPTPRESPQESLAPAEPQPRPGRRARRAAKSEQSESALVRIVAIETPGVGTTLFHAADGRVFVRERARTVPRWPEPPFDVELQTSTFGTSTYLNFPGMNLRVRVALRE